MEHKPFTLEDHLKENLKDPKFRRVWEETRLEYELARSLIRSRLQRKLSHKEIAKRASLSEATIISIEGMNANPSLTTLRRIAKALGTNLVVQFK